VTNFGQIILLPLPKEGMLWIFPAGKIRRFRRERTRDLGYQRPACKPLDHHSRLRFDHRTIQPVVSRFTDWVTRSTS
jgi:hypothetical protein